MVHPVRPRAARILGEIDSYRSLGLGSSIPFAVPARSFGSMGDILGVYENASDDKVFVTDSGLVICKGSKVESIRYKDIAKAEVEGNDKTSVENIIVTMKNGDSHLVPIRNGKGQCRDVWEFWRFLDRVYKDVQKNPSLVDKSTESSGTIPVDAAEDASKVTRQILVYGHNERFCRIIAQILRGAQYEPVTNTNQRNYAVTIVKWAPCANALDLRDKLRSENTLPIVMLRTSSPHKSSAPSWLVHNLKAATSIPRTSTEFSQCQQQRIQSICQILGSHIAHTLELNL